MAMPRGNSTHCTRVTSVDGSSLCGKKGVLHEPDLLIEAFCLSILFLILGSGW